MGRWLGFGVSIGGEFMDGKLAWVSVTKTIGHCARVTEGSTEYFDAEIFGRYRVERFASIMRKQMDDSSVVCLSVQYDIKHYRVDVEKLAEISEESR